MSKANRCQDAGNADGLGPQREQELRHACVLLQVQSSPVLSNEYVSDATLNRSLL